MNNRHTIFRSPEEKKEDEKLSEKLKANPNNKISGKVYASTIYSHTPIQIDPKALKILFPDGIPEEFKDFTEEKSISRKNNK